MRNKSISAMQHCLVFVTAVTLAASTLAAWPAWAADAAKEAATAAQHAGLAAQATIIDTVHAHLHHTVNCLVGPKGEGFDAKQMNPCDGMGSGAIPDTADAVKKKTLSDGLQKAMAGLASNDLTEAKKDAAESAAALKGAM
ncbi:MAG: hypothetical protein WAN51_07150 [Alphaproteobacteria bacterium]